MEKAALKAEEAADQLDAWLRQQRGSVPDDGRDAPRMGDLSLAEGMAAIPVEGEPAAAETAKSPAANALNNGTHDSPRPASPYEGRSGAGLPIHLSHTDWLHHRLVVTGPADALAAFQAAASGAGTIPWHLDGDRMAEDLFHLLVAPPAPQRRRLSLAGARQLARQLREAAELRHAAACARVSLSQACALDLHALLPMPPDILRLGPDALGALAWLWGHWGTTAPLRHVTVKPPSALRTPLPAGTATVQISFWSADWTPWRALADVAARWLTLRFDIRPTYGSL